MSVPGRFIVFEGIDGSGKSTQIAHLAEHLRSKGHPAMATREPSDGPVGVLLRDILAGVRVGRQPMDGPAMALLFAADRRDHLAREIEPALAEGTHVLCDRYLFSSLAYQATEADLGWVASLSVGVRQADMTVLLDVPVEVASARRRLAGRLLERYDDDARLAHVAENYRHLAVTRLGVLVVDGSRSIEEVAQTIAEAVGRSWVTAEDSRC